MISHFSLLHLYLNKGFKYKWLHKFWTLIDKIKNLGFNSKRFRMNNNKPVCTPVKVNDKLHSNDVAEKYDINPEHFYVIFPNNNNKLPTLSWKWNAKLFHHVPTLTLVESSFMFIDLENTKILIPRGLFDTLAIPLAFSAFLFLIFWMRCLGLSWTRAMPLAQG